MLRITAQDICLVFEECPSIRNAQRTPCLMIRAIHCLESLIKASEITSICVILSSNCEVGPPFVLHHSKLELEVAADVAKSSLFYRTGRVSQVSLVGLVISSPPSISESLRCFHQTSLFSF